MFLLPVLGWLFWTIEILFKSIIIILVMDLDGRIERFFVGPDREGDNNVSSTTRGGLVLVACDSGRYMLERMKSVFDAHIPDEDITYMMNPNTRFADGEIGCRFSEHVGGKDVFIVQALFDPRPREKLEDYVRNLVEKTRSGVDFDVEKAIKNLPKIRSLNSNLMETLITIRTARVNGAKNITAVLPYLAYARQDKPTDFMRENCTGKLVADLLYESGVDKIVTWHPHSPQIRMAYERKDKPGSNFLSPVDFFMHCFNYIRESVNHIVLSLDAGAAKTITNVANGLEIDFGIGSKDRPKKDVAKVSAFAADFSGKRYIILIDDLISTGGSYESGADVAVAQAKASSDSIEKIDGAVSHPLLIGNALDILRNLREKHGFEKLYTTDTIPLTKRILESGLVEPVSIAPILALVINRIHYEMPLQNVFWQPEEKE